jgi:hypothetical protein
MHHQFYDKSKIVIFSVLIYTYIFFLQMIQTFRIEYHHEKLQYRIHPMYTPDGPLRFRLIERE